MSAERQSLAEAVRLYLLAWHDHDLAAWAQREGGEWDDPAVLAAVVESRAQRLEVASWEVDAAAKRLIRRHALDGEHL